LRRWKRKRDSCGNGNEGWIPAVRRRNKI